VEGSIFREDLLTGKRSILVLRPDAIGDCVLCSAFFRELRRSVSQDVRITLAVQEKVFPVVETCPYVDEVVLYEPLRSRAESLKERYDIALAPRWDIDYYGTYEMMAKSEIPVRVGYSCKVNQTKARMNSDADRFLTHPILYRDLRHEVEYNLEFLRFIGGDVVSDDLEVWIPDDAYKWAESFVGSREIFALIVGGTAPFKRWPVGFYEKVAMYFMDRYDWTSVILGGDNVSGDWTSFFSKKTNAVNGVGRFSLKQAAALLSRCKFAVGNDTGMTHISAALGVKTIELTPYPETGGDPFHPLSIRRFGGRGRNSLILQPRKAIPPCKSVCSIMESPHCIADIDPERVIEAVESMLSG